jgi:hypothetical protein
LDLPATQALPLLWQLELDLPQLLLPTELAQLINNSLAPQRLTLSMRFLPAFLEAPLHRVLQLEQDNQKPIHLEELLRIFPKLPQT